MGVECVNYVFNLRYNQKHVQVRTCTCMHLLFILIRTQYTIKGVGLNISKGNELLYIYLTTFIIHAQYIYIYMTLYKPQNEHQLELHIS